MALGICVHTLIVEFGSLFYFDPMRMSFLQLHGHIFEEKGIQSQVLYEIYGTSRSKCHAAPDLGHDYLGYLVGRLELVQEFLLPREKIEILVYRTHRYILPRSVHSCGGHSFRHHLLGRGLHTAGPVLPDQVSHNVVRGEYPVAGSDNHVVLRAGDVDDLGHILSCLLP